MKKLLISFAIILFTYTAQACPFCGCGGSNLYIGLLPDFQRGFVGVRYQYYKFHTTLLSDPSQYSTNYYNVVEAWGGVNIGHRFQVLGFVPYYSNKQIDDDGVSMPHGLGDASVIGQYKLFNSTRLLKNGNIIRQQLWFGGGLKLPTGHFNLEMNNPDVTVADVNAQLGTGSTDVLLNGTYNVRIENLGANLAANYSINTVNNQQYRFGNKLATNLVIYYRLGRTKHSLTPNVGINYEQVGVNSMQAVKVRYTGSNITSAVSGLEFNVKKIGIGLNVQLPIAQSFSEGQTRMNVKALLHLSYTL